MPFQPGNNANPNGRPKKSIEEKYLKRLSSRVSLKDWDAIIDKACEQAKRGDYQARKWLSENLIGSPVQRHELSSPNSNSILVKLVNNDRSPD